MTFEEFQELSQRPVTSQRRGQFAFNKLNNVRPDIADAIVRSGEHDPFYDEGKLSDFYEFVKASW